MSQEVYIIAQIDVKNRDYKSYFEEYALKFKEILPKYQGVALVGTTKAEVLEGEQFGNWTVILKFPSRELAQACINSEEYAPIAKKRIAELQNGGNVLLVPAQQ